MLFHDTALLEAIDEFDADGVVYHPIKSCRTVSTGLADSRRQVLDNRDVLCLYLKNRIDAFFEGLDSRALRRASAAAGGAS